MNNAQTAAQDSPTLALLKLDNTQVVAHLHSCKNLPSFRLHAIVLVTSEPELSVVKDLGHQDFFILSEVCVWREFQLEATADCMARLKAAKDQYLARRKGRHQGELTRKKWNRLVIQGIREESQLLPSLLFTCLIRAVAAVCSEPLLNVESLDAFSRNRPPGPPFLDCAVPTRDIHVVTEAAATVLDS